MAYSSPTIIFYLDIEPCGFVTVTDVSGTFAVQVYRKIKGGRTSLIHSETWSTPESAIVTANKYAVTYALTPA